MYLISADLGREGNLLLDVNYNNLPEDGPTGPKYVGNKNKLVYIYIYGVFYVAF